MLAELAVGFVLGRLSKSCCPQSRAACHVCGRLEHSGNVLARLGNNRIPFCAWCCNSLKPRVSDGGETITY
jgi:hypothetical protein